MVKWDAFMLIKQQHFLSTQDLLYTPEKYTEKNKYDTLLEKTNSRENSIFISILTTLFTNHV